MWRTNRGKHCTDEELIGHLDGEISRRHSAEVEHHLQSCWECRARSACLNEQAQKLARMFVSSSYLGPDALIRGKARLRLRQGAFERELASRTRPRIARFRWAAVGTAAATLLFCTVWWLRPVPPPALMARIDGGAALQRAGRQELQAGANRAVHQVYSVEIIQERPKPRRAIRRLDIWDDPGGARYTSTLRDPGGRLRFGIWVPGTRIPEGGAGYELAREDRAVTIPIRPVLAAAGSAVDSIVFRGDDPDEMLKSWLRQRHWQRLALATDFQAFASEDAVVLTVQQIGAGQLRLTARRLSGDIRLTATLELDGAGRPKFHSMRVETAGRATELRLREEQFETLAQDDIEPSVFEPGVPVVPSPGRGVGRPLDTARDLTGERELEAYYALHRAGACQKETLEVRSEPGGQVAVRLLAADEARQSELRQTLARNAAAAGWDVSIQIGQPKSHTRTGPAGAQQAMELAAKWNGVWEEGLALVDLASHFGPEVRAGLSPEARILLQAMLRDHAAALTARVGSVRASLSAGAPVPAPGQTADEAGGDWPEAYFRLYQAIDRLDRLIEDGSTRQAGIPPQELPLLQASLTEVDFFAGLVMQSGDTPRTSVSGVRSSSGASSPRPRLGKGAPK